MNGGRLGLINKLKNADIGIACILACLYFLALPLTITLNSSGSSFLKVVTLPIAGYFAVSIFFYGKELELNSVHLCSFVSDNGCDHVICGQQQRLPFNMSEDISKRSD